MANAANFRRLALALEGASEHPHFDRRALKARITFATLAPDEMTANFKFSPEDQHLKCTVAPDAFRPVPNAWGLHGWTEGKLNALSDAELLAALEIAHASAAASPTKKKKRF